MGAYYQTFLSEPAFESFLEANFPTLDSNLIGEIINKFEKQLNILDETLG